ncbi:MAG: type III-A CRISPR-associated protein Cas10/Csm1 [bacterium]
MIHCFAYLFCSKLRLRGGMKLDDNKILLSALLHDFGKALERTKEYNSRELPQDIKSTGNYAHPKYSAFFVRILRSIERLTDFLKENLTEEVEELVLTHHNPVNEYGLIIQIADWLSSSEREESETEKGYYINIPLSTPFKRIDENAEDLHYPLSDLNNIIPKKREKISIDENKYSALLNPLLKKFQSINDIEQILTLLEFYLSQVPAQTTGYLPDISLYDHSRITAALSHILYKDYIGGLLTKDDLEKIREFLRTKSLSKEVSEKPLFTLISGDLSGIQSFLFNISSERAGRMLKGKSVFLDLLTRYSSKYILENTGFTRANVIYLGGGNFDLLISHTPHKKLEELRAYIVENLWKLLGEEIYLGIEWMYLSINDLLYFIDKKEELSFRLDERKRRKFSELKNFYELVLKPKEEEIGEGEYCTVCGKKKSKNVSIQERWCKTCESFVRLADEELEKSRYLIEEKSNLDKDPETVKEFFEKLGYSLSFSEDPFYQKESKIYQLEDINITDKFIPYGFLLGSYNILESDFEGIAQRNIIKEFGDKRLAYLKMDADNMGHIFKRLSDKERERGLSLTRYGVLSRRIELFFGKEVLELIKGSNEIYPVFIGGDDLFLIGTYERLNKLVLEVRNRYMEYTGSKDVFTISTGIYYLPHDFPLIRGARLVEEALDTAKGFRYPEEEKEQKDKVCVEEEVLTYREFKEALDIAEDLSKRILMSDLEKQTSRSVISKIEKSIKGFSPLLESSLRGKITPPAIWRFMYYLRDQKEIAERLSQIILYNLLHSGEKIRNPRLILVATKIARMKTRRREV